LSERLAQLDTQQPRLRDLGDFGMALFEHIPCRGGANHSLLCLTELLAPLLRVQGSVNVITAVRNMAGEFFKPRLSPRLEALIVERGLISSAVCNDIEIGGSSAMCRALSLQRSRLETFYESIHFELRVTPSLAEKIEASARNCWINCGLVARTFMLKINSLYRQQRIWSLVLQMGATLCESNDCAKAVVASLLEIPFAVRAQRFYLPLNPVLFLIGLLVDLLVLLCCVVCIMLVAFVWKVARSALLYLVLLCLLMVSEIMAVAYWSVNLSLVVYLSTATDSIGGAPHILVFVILMFMTLDWIFALPVVLQKVPWSAKSEMAIRFVYLGLGSAFALTVTVGALFFSAQTFDEDRVAPRLVLALRIMTLCQGAFIFGCSVLSLILVKRSPNPSPNTLRGLIRILVLSLVVFSTSLALALLYGATTFRTYRMFVPEWLTMTVAGTLLHALRQFSILILLVMSAKARASKVHVDSLSRLFGGSMKSSLLQNIAEEQEDAKEIPMQYRI